MSIQADQPLPAPALGEQVETGPDDWEFDVTFIESGVGVELRR